jgi:hypothetical protein
VAQTRNALPSMDMGLHLGNAFSHSEKWTPMGDVHALHLAVPTFMMRKKLRK